MRRAPLRGAAPHEGLPLRTAREVPRLVRGRAGAQVQREAQERELPAHPDGPWPIGRPMVVVADDVPEPELGAILDRRQVDGHEAHIATELPRDGEPARRSALGDLASGVALELEAAAKAQVAGDGQEPAGNPLGVRAHVPDVRDRRVVDATQLHDVRGPVGRRLAADSPPHSLELGDQVVHAACSLRFALVGVRWRPRASSVSIASKRWLHCPRRSASQPCAASRPVPSRPYSRRVPAERTVANPFSRSPRRCRDTAGWVRPNSPWMAAATSPARCSPVASSSRMRRRTGSPRTPKVSITAHISIQAYIRQPSIRIPCDDCRPAWRGYHAPMDVEARISSVKTNETRNGNTRWTVVDESGAEYTTFRPAIGTAAEQAEGKLARISFHEEERNGFRNVYLDGIEPVERQQPAPGGQETDSDPEEAAWRTAVDAAPYLLGKEAGDGELEPEEAFEKLKPFKDLVSEDIRSGPDGGGDAAQS